MHPPRFLSPGSLGLMVCLILAMAMQTPVELKVMTYNIRYATAPDGPNAWPNRRQALLDLIKKHDPDVLGVQEALASQLEEIQATLPNHLVLGVGRDDGLRKGEFSAILYRKSRLGLREGGTRWISPDPLRPGSLAFDARVTRVFTWGEFFTSSGQRVLIINTHLDHEAKRAMLLGGQQIRAFCDERPQLPALVMGDWNSAETDPPALALMEGGRFRHAKPTEGPFGTFTAFKPENTSGPQIDHIFATPIWDIVSTIIDRTLYDGKAPSDHFPIVATVRLR